MSTQPMFPTLYHIPSSFPGFMREREYLQCLHYNTLLDDGVTNQSVAIVLPVTYDDREHVLGEKAFTLRYNGNAVAIIRNPEIFEHRKEERCGRQWGLTSTGHPYVKKVQDDPSGRRLHFDFDLFTMLPDLRLPKQNKADIGTNQSKQNIVLVL